MNVLIGPSFDGAGRRGPFLVYSALWIWAAYRLHSHRAPEMAGSLSVISLSVAVVAVVGVVLFLDSWPDLGSVHIVPEGWVQLAVPVVGSFGVLLALRNRRV